MSINTSAMMSSVLWMLAALFEIEVCHGAESADPPGVHWCLHDSTCQSPLPTPAYDLAIPTGVGATFAQCAVVSPTTSVLYLCTAIRGEGQLLHLQRIWDVELWGQWSEQPSSIHHTRHHPPRCVSDSGAAVMRRAWMLTTERERTYMHTTIHRNDALHS